MVVVAEIIVFDSQYLLSSVSWVAYTVLTRALGSGCHAHHSVSEAQDREVRCWGQDHTPQFKSTST